MLAVALWHHPTCSKSQRALEHLRELGLDVQVREVLVSPPSREELERVLTALKLRPSELARKKEPLFSELGLDGASEGNILDALSTHPVLIERPIALREDRGTLRAALGRPPIRVLEVVAPSMELAPHVAEAIAQLNPQGR
jgi:arsenate reductase